MPMSEFEPEDEERDIAMIAIGLGLGDRQVARRIKNPRTGKPITEATFKTTFPEEIQDGSGALIYMVGREYLDIALHCKHPETKRKACEFFLTRRGGDAWQERLHVDSNASIQVIPGAIDIVRDKVANCLRNEPPAPVQPMQQPIRQLEVVGGRDADDWNSTVSTPDW